MKLKQFSQHDKAVYQEVIFINLSIFAYRHKQKLIPGTDAVVEAVGVSHALDH